MSYTNPVVADFKAYFVRDFTYGSTTATVMDADIQSGINDSAGFINPNLFSAQDSYTAAFLQLSAHFMVLNLRAANQGLGLQGQYPWLQNSKAVGSVSESFSIPDRILANPEFSMLSKTYYGAKFLFMILPLLSGQIFTVGGCTQP